MDENVPTEVSDFIAVRGYRVAHIGRTAPYLVDAPSKAIEDARLRWMLRSFIFMTQDKRLLRPGAFPNDHRGVFVLDTDGTQILSLVRHLFDNTQWKRDDLFINRRFLVVPGRIDEVAVDGSRSTPPWPVP